MLVPKMNRRTFIKQGSSVAVGTLAFGGKAIAGTGGQSLEEANIKKAYDKLIKKGKLDQAERLLQNHNVTYERSTIPVGNKQSTGDVSTELYSESKAQVDLYAVHDWDNYYSADLYWTMYADNAIDTPGPNDGVGVSFASARWAYEPGTAETSAYTSGVDPNPEGVIAEFDDLDAYNNQEQPNDGYLLTQLEKQESGQHNIYGHYGHTYYSNGTGSGGVSFSISVGFLGISFSGSAEKWKKPSNTVEI